MNRPALSDRQAAAEISRLRRHIVRLQREIAVLREQLPGPQLEPPLPEQQDQQDPFTSTGAPR